MTRTLKNPLPASPWCSLVVSIEKIVPEAPGVATYHLRFRDPAEARRYHFQPGQFNMLYLPGVGEVAISLSADPASSGTLAHTIRVAGNVTRSLAALRPGDTLGLRGAYGQGWPLDAACGADVVLVAGGIGLAPLRPAICHLLAHRSDYGNLTLLYARAARRPSLHVAAHGLDRPRHECRNHGRSPRSRLGGVRRGGNAAAGAIAPAPAR